VHGGRRLEVVEAVQRIGLGQESSLQWVCREL
jgi:hypothetical protein